MSALTSLLVRDEVVSVRQIEDALQRQVLEGGEIDTALLELEATPENVLNAYRAASYGLPAAPREKVMAPPAELVSRVPEALAKKYRIVPLALRDGAFVLATAQPLADAALRELGRELGAGITLEIATEVRIEAALLAHYGCEIAPRMRRLAGELEMRDAGRLPRVDPMRGADAATLARSELLGVLDDDETDDPPADAEDPSTAPAGAAAEVSPSDAAAASVVQVRAQTISGRASAAPRVSSAGGQFVLPSAARLRSLTPRARPRRANTVPKGPLTKDVARELLEKAQERDQIVEVFFRYARQYFDSTALFSVRDDRALGLESHNMPSLADIREISVLFERGTALDDVMRSLSPKVVDLSRKEANLAFANALGRSASQPSVIIPVCIRQRVVSLVYGDRDGEPFRLDDIADLIELLPSVARAFERIIRTRKGFAMHVRRSLRPEAMPASSAALAEPEAQPATRSSPTPRASWSAPAAAPAQPSRAQSSRPPGVVAGVFPGSSADPSAPRRSATTLTDVADQAPATSDRSGQRSSRTFEGFAQSETPVGLLHRHAREALSVLGVPRSAPPPPAAISTEDRARLEQHPTMRLSAQTPAAPAPVPDASGWGAGTNVTESASAARLSKPPPGAGAYHSNPPPAADEDDALILPGHERSHPAEDTRPIRRSRPVLRGVHSSELPDTHESHPSPHSFRSRPPARSEKQPPGSGAYKAQDLESEVVTLPPPPPEAAGATPRPSVPSAAGYSSQDVPSDVVVLPPPPRLPGATARAAADGGKAAAAVTAAQVSQPITPKLPTKRPQATDARRDAEPQLAPSEDVVSVSAALRESLRPPASVVHEPSIIVDTRMQVDQLVHDLCRLGPDDESRAVQSLLRFGDEALAVLASHFPGPLWFDRRRAHIRLPLGRDVSAIARALSAFGARATPKLAALLSDGQPEVRFYATLLVSDRVEPELLQPLVERLFDEDPQIRLIVKDVLPHYRAAPGFALVLDQLRSSAADPQRRIPARLAALDALSVLRDAASVPLLIELGADSDKQISLPAHRALVTITAQDFGAATKRWRAFWDEHGDRHRVEWLIDSLMHGDQALRATAGIELQKLTQVYYGFVATAPKRDRERAQRRYREWWQNEGKRKFSRR